MNQSIDLSSQIKGWGADLDPKNRPGVPMERTPPNGTGAHWTVPEQQTARVKIYHSIERPGITPVFGTSCPPTGLSGRIRDIAYRYSEAQLSHWMLLLFADRINVFEGVIDDFRKGGRPHPFREMGLWSELRLNPQRVKKVALFAGLGIAAIVGLSALSRQRQALQG